MKKLILSVLLCLVLFSAYSQDFPKAIMMGDYPDPTILRENDVAESGNNRLMVSGKGESPADGRLLLVTPQHKDYEVVAEVSVGEMNMSGLLLYYSERAYAGLLSDGEILRIYLNADEYKDIKSSFGRDFFVRLHNDCNTLNISVSNDGKEWETIADSIDVSMLHHNNYNGFFALRPALCVAGKGTTEFRDFNYLPK